ATVSISKSSETASAAATLRSGGSRAASAGILTSILVASESASNTAIPSLLLASLVIILIRNVSVFLRGCPWQLRGHGLTDPAPPSTGSRVLTVSVGYPTVAIANQRPTGRLPARRSGSLVKALPSIMHAARREDSDMMVSAGLAAP